LLILVNESLSCEESISNDPINEIIDQQNESIQEKRKKNKRDQHTGLLKKISLLKRNQFLFN
jgi:hypothetical protein